MQKEEGNLAEGVQKYSDETLLLQVAGLAMILNDSASAGREAEMIVDEVSDR